MTTELTAYLSTRCATPSVFLSHKGLRHDAGDNDDSDEGAN